MAEHNAPIPAPAPAPAPGGEPRYLFVLGVTIVGAALAFLLGAACVRAAVRWA